MDFNFDKYKNRKFHENVDTDKKVKALFLYYDYQVISRKLDLAQQLTLLDHWIEKFQQHELYEVIPMFKMRRAEVIKLIIRLEQDKIDGVVTFETVEIIEELPPKLNKTWENIKYFFKNLFNKK